jgi:hypothetical protein
MKYTSILLCTSLNLFLSLGLALISNLPSRRAFTEHIFLNVPVTISTIPCLISSPQAANADSLAAKLSKRNASVLKNSVFNIPPSVQIYPPFMRGNWDVTLSFAGYLFPSTSIPKDKIVSNYNIPGFQKCSIATISDIGKNEATFQMNISKDGVEDRKTTLQTSINSHLGYNAIEKVLYDPSSNPNRISIDFIPNRTRNANRIELFCNARESELVTKDTLPTTTTNATTSTDDSLSIFVNSEYLRQVTFGLSQEFGIARQVVGNYAHFWTWREQLDRNTMKGNVLTAVYLDPQDPMFFDEPSKPVAVYSHQIIANKIL